MKLLVGTLERPLARHARKLTAERDRVDRGERREVAIALGHVADAPSRLLPGAADVDAEDRSASSVRAEQPEDRLEEGALPRAVRAEAAGRAARGRDRRAVPRADRAVPDREALGLDQRSRGGHERNTLPAARAAAPATLGSWRLSWSFPPTRRWRTSGPSSPR